MKNVLAFLALIMANIAFTKAQNFEYLPIYARPGETIKTLLQQYNLEDSDCNKQHFYKINDLNSNTGLIAHKSYKLPIKIFTYNKKSIRSTINNEDLDKAKEVQSYNELLLDERIVLSDFRSGAALYVPIDIYDCNTLTTKPNLKTTASAGKRIYPIFGPDYEYVPLVDQRLSGNIYYVVAGHGGPDPGAIGQSESNDLCEDEYAYDVALRLARNLLSHGAIAYVITRDPNDGIRDEAYLPCDKDEYCWEDQVIPLDQKSRLSQRSDAINDLYDHHSGKGLRQRMVVIHVDSRNDEDRVDMFFYHSNSSEKGKNLATTLQKTVNNKYEYYQKGRGYEGSVSSRDLHMLRETKPTGVYIELGNIRNKADQKRFLIKNNRQAIADWLVEGLKKESTK